MSKKNKKLSKRSLYEAKKAQTLRKVEEISATAAVTFSKGMQLFSKKEIQLPVAQIKKELVKNLLFITLLLTLFLILAKTQFGYSYIQSLVKL